MVCTSQSSSTTGPQAAKAAVWSKYAGSVTSVPSASVKASKATCRCTEKGPTPSVRMARSTAASRSSTQ